MKYYLQHHLFHLNFTTQKETTVIAKYEVMEKVTVKDMGEKRKIGRLPLASVVIGKGEQEKKVEALR